MRGSRILSQGVGGGGGGGAGPALDQGGFDQFLPFQNPYPGKLRGGIRTSCPNSGSAHATTNYFMMNHVRLSQQVLIIGST